MTTTKPDRYTVGRALLDLAETVPGRSNTRSKAPGKLFDLDRGPLYMREARGCRITDVDGNEFIDMVCALGAVSLGYDSQRYAGYALLGLPQLGSLPLHLEATVGSYVLPKLAPWADRLRVVRTGSEALTGAVMMARRATGRRLVLVARGSYHGWHGWTSQRGEKDTEGEHTMEFEYGTVPAKMYLRMAAAVVIEPARWQATPGGYLQDLQDAARECGALYVVDEMIYGGRFALGGATEEHDLHPDLACFGKAIGNGAPVAIIFGERKLMDAHAQVVSGTYSGDAHALVSVMQTLSLYEKDDVVATLWARGSQLKRMLQRAAADAGMADRVEVRGAMAPHLHLSFAAYGRPGAERTFSALMADEGVLWHPDVTNVCAAHTEQDIEEVGQAAHEALRKMAATE